VQTQSLFEGNFCASFLDGFWFVFPLQATLVYGISSQATIRKQGKRDMSNIVVVMGPEQREKHIETMLRLDGLGDVRENRLIGYGIIALTGLGNNVSSENEHIKTYLGSRQAILAAAMKQGAGITLYDPASAPYSPDKNLTAQPNEIFMVDSARVGMARHITFADVLPTTGGGIELEKARRLGKFMYIFHDPKIRTSRMQPDRAFHLSVENFAGNKNHLAEIFAFVNEYDPALGFDDGVPSMLGVHRRTGSVVNLEKEVKINWPELVYQYNGNVQILIMACQNPQVFFEALPTTVEAYKLREDHKLIVLRKSKEITDCFVVCQDGQEVTVNVQENAEKAKLLQCAARALTRRYADDDEDTTISCFNFSSFGLGAEKLDLRADNLCEDAQLISIPGSHPEHDTILMVDPVAGCRLSLVREAKEVQRRFDALLSNDASGHILVIK
jgi:hypothetical protein